jgi:hypothetical protein
MKKLIEKFKNSFHYRTKYMGSKEIYIFEKEQTRENKVPA